MLAPYADKLVGMQNVGIDIPMAQVLGVVGLQVNQDGSLKVEINTTFTSAAQFTAVTSSARNDHR